MTSPTNPNLTALKSEAKSLRRELTNQGAPITQSQALERVARGHGARDWNTLSARARQHTPATPVVVGQRLRGRYLGQSFVGEVIGLAEIGQTEQYRVTVQLDSPVDVVEFESFSNFRHRITCVVGSNGVSKGRRSDGTPHLVLST